METTEPLPANSPSKTYRGIVRYRNGKWLAKTTGGGKSLSLGYYDKAEDAAKAYDYANLLLGRGYIERNIEGLPDLALMEKIHAILRARKVVSN